MGDYPVSLNALESRLIGGAWSVSGEPHRLLDQIAVAWHSVALRLAKQARFAEKEGYVLERDTEAVEYQAPPPAKFLC